MVLEVIDKLSKEGYSLDLKNAVENYILFNSKTEKKNSLKQLYVDRIRRYISDDEFCRGIRRLFDPIGNRAPEDVPQPNSKP